MINTSDFDKDGKRYILLGDLLEEQFCGDFFVACFDENGKFDDKHSSQFRIDLSRCNMD